MIPHWLLLEIGLPVEMVKLDLASREHKRPEYLALNPAGTVPTLVVGDQVITESAAILLWLVEQAPGQWLAPAMGTAQRAQFLQHVVHLANTLQPAFRRWFYPEEAAGAAAAAANKQHAERDIALEWERWNGLLAERPYLLGTDISAADFYLCVLMRWSRNMPRPATDWPHLARFAATLKARPSFALLYQREELTDWT
ncbi:glutathione S-transferase family protein [Pseudoxanthomonas sp. CAU 1598]|uniref:Glutathione S-transferase family protein n=2 Tax=Pseudomarimonas arenosa TaxID=2774145 RepID=A0AAW3ZQK9_9GAMM|nr:glutathione S-transferase family protein [Pseudomarimonas arenosa]